MTDFRQMHSLHAYSGGTVRDSHPVFYSPVGLLPRPQALKRNIYLLLAYHFRKDLSITFEVRTCDLCQQIATPITDTNAGTYEKKSINKTSSKSVLYFSVLDKIWT